MKKLSKDMAKSEFMQIDPTMGYVSISESIEAIKELSKPNLTVISKDTILKDFK